MKKINWKLLVIFTALFAATFTSCDDEENNNNRKSFDSIYIVNYGGYGKSNSTIDSYDEEGKQISYSQYLITNEVNVGSNVQSATIVDSTMYLMSNTGDKIDIINAATLEVIANPISEGITKPRYAAAYKGKLYVSCWGNADWSVMADSYIAVIDIASNKLEKKIKLEGGPEGVVIKDGILYTCMEFRKQIAIIDLSTEAIEYIELSAVSMHLDFDKDGKLWVSIVNSPSNPADTSLIGIAIINTTTKAIEKTINIPGIDFNGYFAKNYDGSTFYVLCNEPWPGTKSKIVKIDASKMEVSTSAFVEGENFNGIGYNTETDKLYLLISPSNKEEGILKVYNTDGILYDTQTTGIGPLSVVFY